MEKRVSTLITTKNRPEQIKRCLESICRQTVKPAEVIIVDASDMPQKTLLNIFKNKLAIRCYYRPSTNIPEGRNVCIQKATNSLSLFIDDDCIASKTWVEDMLIAYLRHRDATLILGNVDHMPKKGVYAEIIRNIRTYRENLSLNTDSPFIDTSNCLLDLAKLKNNKIKFDVTMPRGEDSDLLFQIIKKGGKAYRAVRGIVYHYERENLFAFLCQRFKNAGNTIRLSMKWPNKKLNFYSAKRTKYFTPAIDMFSSHLRAGRWKEMLELFGVLFLSAVSYELGHVYYGIAASFKKRLYP